MERKGLKLGTKIKISDLGTFIVKDRTSRRNRGNLDIFMKSYTKAFQLGRHRTTLVLNRYQPIPMTFGAVDFLHGIFPEIKRHKELFWAYENTNHNLERLNGKRYVYILN